MVRKVPKNHESAIKFACELYGIQCRFLTYEKNPDFLLLDVELSEDEAWLVSEAVQMKLIEDVLKGKNESKKDDEPSDDLLNFFKGIYNP